VFPQKRAISKYEDLRHTIYEVIRSQGV
jgi:hypothetical protein